MEAQEFKELIPDYVLGKLTSQQEKDFNACLEAHPELQEELGGWDIIKQDLDRQDFESSENMDTKFYDFLKSELNAETQEEPVKVRELRQDRSSFFSRSNILFPLLAASIMLMFGFFIGKSWNNTSNPVETKYVDKDILEYKKENEEVRTQLVMSLADESSASKRLQAVSEASKFDNATDKVIVALFKMLNTDTNVNVRLAAVASLSKYVDNPEVREGLVLSITKQESPLVQIALAELMVTLKEQKSINSMETLLQKPDINSAVKQKLEESIKQII